MKLFAGFGMMHATVFVLFALLSGVYLDRVPGLMGDEASEGENVFQILDTKKITILGERSYIGPLIDYVRIPFVVAFGYGQLSLRVVMLFASLAFFFVISRILIDIMGEEESLLPIVITLFSPIYFTQQRLGWAITLLPVFAVLLVYALRSTWNQKYLLAGLVAGIGLSNHLLFLPTLVAIIAMALVMNIKKPRVLLRAWPMAIGFIAGFIMQFAVLQLYPDDQGSQKMIAETFIDRIYALPSLLPEIISGSSYIASYSGSELSSGFITAVVTFVSLLVLLALTMSRHKKVVWVIFFGLAIHLAVLLRIIDRFSLRYFTLFVLGVWLLSGFGIEAIVAHVRTRSLPIARSITLGIAALFFLYTFLGIIMPFLKTGGSTNVFSLGNRTDSASALVDTKPLLACLRGLGPVFSENVHIYNRMLLWSRQYEDIQVPDEEHQKSATYIVNYRVAGSSKEAAEGGICPSLVHFRVDKI